MEPFVGEVRLFAFGRIPRGWLPCNGQLLPINTNQVLFTLLGVTYGGDGVTTFGLPDLSGRVAISRNDAASPSPALDVHPLGSKGGKEAISMTLAQMPTHTHQVAASTQKENQASPANGFFSASATVDGKALSQPVYAVKSGSAVTLDPMVVDSAGEGAPMANMQPFLTLSYCIASIGIFPPHP
ncbi:MAG: tail fiber protein [Pseudomonas farsensis]|uniref:phage tail protein n=1 Tax=Pseudomonas farsensis TaxID=2745492 RepID=UPI003C7CB7F9